jgi:hypothetical protein
MSGTVGSAESIARGAIHELPDENENAAFAEALGLGERPVNPPPLPQTPPPTVMTRYQNLNSLPAATHMEGGGFQYGRRLAVFGDENSRASYEDVRRYAVESGRLGQKVLANSEQGAGPRIGIHPYVRGSHETPAFSAPPLQRRPKYILTLIPGRCT